MAEKKTAGEHLDATIAKTRRTLHTSKEYLKKRLRRDKAKAAEKDAAGPAAQKRLLLVLVALVGVALIALLIWFATAPTEKATTQQAQEIAKMLSAEGVTIQGIGVTRHGYAITYAAESATDRFDDALLYDWAVIYAVAANFRCDEVSITTTLDNQPLHKQTATCPTVRAFARGVLTEQEFWMLVEHESLG